MERAYQLYLTVLVAGAAAVPVQAGLRGRLAPSALDQLRIWAPLSFGLVVASVIGVGLSAGVTGAPYTPSLATVHHELRAPLDVGVVLRAELARRLRAAGALGALWAAVVGLVVGALLDRSLVVVVAGSALTGGLAAVLGGALAAVVATVRLPDWAPGLLASPVIGWSLWDVWHGRTTSPLSRIGQALVEPVQAVPWVLALAGVTVVTVLVAAKRAPRVPLERLIRRAGLTSQVRFAASMLDFRTVVLLRRASRAIVREPVVRRLPAWVGPIRFRRVLASWSTVGVAGLVRGVLAAMVVGGLVGVGLTGRPWTLAAAAVLLVPFGYRLVEPVSQELDHPGRWFGHPHGSIRHLGGLMLAAVPASVAVLLLGAPLAVAFGLGPLSAVLALVVIGWATVLTGAWSSIAEPPDLIAAALMGEMGGAYVAMKTLTPLVPLVVVIALPPWLIDRGVPTGAAVASTLSPILAFLFVTAFRLRYVRPWS